MRELGFKLDKQQFLAPFKLFEEVIIGSDTIPDSAGLVPDELFTMMWIHGKVSEAVATHRIRHVRLIDPIPTWNRGNVRWSDLQDYLVANDLELPTLREGKVSGLTLILMALPRLNGKGNCTLTQARKAIAAAAHRHEQRWSDGKQREYWPHYRALAPLWAGILMESGCWSADGLFEQDQSNKLDDDILRILAQTDRLANAYGYARWLIEHLERAPRAPIG